MTRNVGIGGLRHATVVVVTAALLLGAALSGATVGVVDADSPSVAVTDESGGNAVEAAPNETVTVTVGANASNVSAYQANLTFDPDVVRVESVSGTDDFDDPVANVDNEGGWVSFNQYRSSNVSDPQLAAVTVELVGDAGDETSLAFVESDTKLSDDAAQERGIEEYNDLTVTIESESDGSDDGSGDDGDSDGGETGDDDTDSGDDTGDTDDGDDGDGTDDGDDGDGTDDGDDGDGTDDTDSGDDTDDTDSGDDTEDDDTDDTDDGDDGDDSENTDSDDDDSNDDSDDDDSNDDDDSDGSSDDDDDDGGGASGGSSGGDSAGGDSGDAEGNDETSEGPPRVVSHSASPDGNASVETTFDGGSPTIERLALLLDSAASGDYVTTEYERLPTDLADSRSDDAADVVTVLEFDAPNESEGAPTQIVLTLNRSAVNASEGNAENLQVERYDEATGQWETLDPAVDNASDGTVTLSVAPSRLGWFVVSAGNASQTDGAAEPANGTDASGNDTANGTGSDSAGTGDSPTNDSDSGDATNDSDSGDATNDSGSGDATNGSDTTGSSSTEEPGSTESEIPGFGVTTVLAAGAALYGIVRFRRRT